MILQTMNSVRSNYLSLKFQISGCKDIVMEKYEFVAKTQLHFITQT